MDFDETMRAQVAAMPRWRFVCEKDWLRGPWDYAIGFVWKRNFDAQPGQIIYRRQIVLRLTFRLRLDRFSY